MPRLILHIGTHKTATTHIQDTFHKNRRLLRRHGLLYPAIGAQRGHHGLASAWIPLNRTYAYRDPARAWARLQHCPDRKIRESDTIFVSSEEFSRWAPHRVDMAHLRRMVSHFDEVRVICVLRNQAAFIQSVYQQVSEDRNPGPIEPYLARTLENDLVEGLFTDYRRLLKHLYSGFDPGEIRLLSYERACGHAHGILGAVLEEVAQGVDPADLLPFGAQNSNMSPEPLATLCANLVATERKAPPWLLRAARLSVEGRFGPARRTTLFTEAEIARIAAHYEPLNRALERTVRPVQPRFRMPEISAALAGRVTREEMDAALFMTLARHLVADQQRE
ncbi:hypothetical protein [Celeribacter indicus]|uniref:Sulfotransferase domain-containing protein n=1 Tax=Celeribacter indicus TaxID=1208324 RepID=A0A0B5DWZ1_9RHOB|nr:hypothetical protein [Celeribacter indicus]AJE44727.1 hypothetical protein P73_0012 [Celeribacter indicus]SDX60438.1 hypothetical protein SAMN05443573_1514 [Celeribacter indicus]